MRVEIYYFSTKHAVNMLLFNSIVSVKLTLLSRNSGDLKWLKMTHTVYNLALRIYQCVLVTFSYCN